MACAGSATTAVSSLPAWYDYGAFYSCADGEDFLAQLCRAVNIRESQIGFIEYEFHLIGSAPDDGALAAEDWITSPPEIPMKSYKTIINECRSRISIMLLSIGAIDGDCKRQAWDDKVSLHADLLAVPAATDLREDWKTTIDGLRDVLDDMTHLYFDGWAEESTDYEWTIQSQTLSEITFRIRNTARQFADGHGSSTITITPSANISGGPSSVVLDSDSPTGVTGHYEDATFNIDASDTHSITLSPTSETFCLDDCGTLRNQT